MGDGYSYYYYYYKKNEASLFHSMSSSSSQMTAFFMFTVYVVICHYIDTRSYVRVCYTDNDNNCKVSQLVLFH